MQPKQLSVIPAKAGIQKLGSGSLDSGFRRNDEEAEQLIPGRRCQVDLMLRSFHSQGWPLNDDRSFSSPLIIL